MRYCKQYAPNGATLREEKSIVEIIKSKATLDGKAKALTFLRHDKNPITYTYFELYQRMLQVSGHLRDMVKSEKPLIIALEPSEQYIIAFLACLCAKKIAIPLYKPKNKTEQQRFHDIVKDSGAEFIISDNPLANLECLNIETLINTPVHCTKLPVYSLDDLAFIQYTSGTTGGVKGVCLTNKNILTNLEVIKQNFACTVADIGYIWLPPFHDMGLIGGILQTFFVGFHTYFSSPDYFVKNPIGWLKGISKYGATISGGPSSAFELLGRYPARRIKEQLDLSCWRIAFCGAENINAKGVLDFFSKFKEFGLPKDSFFPCYGLAEATLYVSGARGSVETHQFCLDQEALANSKLKSCKPSNKKSHTIIGSGKPDKSLEVFIINREGETAKPSEIGEVYVRGDGVSGGYWNKGIIHTNKGLLATGDLGSLIDNTLYIIGREKDLIILNGVNYYVSQLERELNKLSPVFRSNSLIVGQKSDGYLYVAAEIKRAIQSPESYQLALQLQNEIKGKLKIEADDIFFLKKNTLVKTTSGKHSRFQSLRALENGNLEKLFCFKSYEKSLKNDKTLIDHSPFIVKSTLISLLQEISNVNEINGDTLLSSLSLGSLELVTLTEKLSKEFRLRNLSPAIFYDLATIDKINAYLVTLLKEETRQDRLSNTDHYRLKESIVARGKVCKMQEVRNVLLTGANGFFGSFLLEALLKKGNYQITCLVRGKNDSLARARLLQSLKKHKIVLTNDEWKRVEVVCGDLTKEHFAMRTTDHLDLAKKIELVIHSAAEVNFIKSAHALFNNNVLAVERVLEFSCVATLKRVLHLSSYSVLLENSVNSQTMIGYVKSKIQAEKLCQQAKVRGIPVHIIRLGSLSGHSKTGVVNRSDLMSNLLATSFETGFFVKSNTKISFQPVDLIAQDLVSLSLQDDLPFTINLYQTNGLKISTLAFFRRLTGKKIQISAPKIWLEKLALVMKESEKEVMAFLTKVEANELLIKIIELRVPQDNYVSSLKELKINKFSFLKQLKLLLVYFQHFKLQQHLLKKGAN